MTIVDGSKQKYLSSLQASDSVDWYWKNHVTGATKTGVMTQGKHTQDPSQTWTSSSKWTVEFDGYTLTAKRKKVEGDGSFKCTIRVNGVEQVKTGESHNFTFSNLGKTVWEWKSI